MKKEFDYPIDYSLYSIEEITTIISFLDTVEECYSKGVALEHYKNSYKNFKEIVRSKSEENNMLKQFKELSGCDGYLTTKEMKKEVARIRIKS